MLPVVLFLSLGPFPLHTTHDVTPSGSTELLLFMFLVGSILFSFLPLYSLQSGSSSLLFFFTSCQFETHIARC